MARKRKRTRRQTPTEGWLYDCAARYGVELGHAIAWMYENKAPLTAYYRAGRSPADAARRLARAKARGHSHE